MEIEADAKVLVSGVASGPLLVTQTGLSFWGGVDPVSGRVIDQHHPLAGHSLAGKILALPNGRGSSSGSGVLLELLLNENAPKALLFSDAELILTLGVLVAETLFEKSIPVVILNTNTFGQLQSGQCIDMTAERLQVFAAENSHVKQLDLVLPTENDAVLQLSASDQQFLLGEHGKAAAVAMKIVSRMADLQGATSLIDVHQVHIDACVYNGPTSLKVVEQLLAWDARVCVPTTLNSISVDQQRWQEQGVDSTFAIPASRLGDALADMGAQPTFTCAPYLLDTSPQLGEQIAWAESNAVMFANSVIGARTQKYPDFLDICIALTGRAPNTGSHTDAGRLPTIEIQASYVDGYADAYWPLLGYHLGQIAATQLPIVYGLEQTQPTQDDLKAFSAAFATTSATPMFHIVGQTPEAEWAAESIKAGERNLPRQFVDAAGLSSSFDQLNSAACNEVGVVALGNPHFSVTECRALADLLRGRERKPTIELVVTLSRTVYAAAESEGIIRQFLDFGVKLVTDTCWCMITEPVIPSGTVALMTNSGKYAHYAPGLTGRKVRFDALSACVDIACRKP